MSRRPSWIPPRKAIPAATIRAVMERSDGVCEVEGCKKPGKEFNHKTGVAFGSGDGPDDVELLCRKHHAPHTAEITKRATKADHMGGRIGQFARRKKAQAAGKHKAIQGPGFQTNKDAPFKRKMSGEIVRRKGA